METGRDGGPTSDAVSRVPWFFVPFLLSDAQEQVGTVHRVTGSGASGRDEQYDE